MGGIPAGEGTPVEAWDEESIADDDLLALGDDLLALGDDLLALGDDFPISSSAEAELIILANTEGNRGTKRRGSPLLEDRTHKSPRHLDKKLKILSEKILREKFGIQSFRHKQGQAILRLLRGESAVVVFPTGGGKSLCYQLPALAFSEVDKLDHVNRPLGSGITLVVSPLIALMKDQTDTLIRRGIPAATLDSTKSRVDYLKICDMMRNDELKILYVAPERLSNEGFVAQIASVRGGVRMVAVDEAHCISEWGHSFRPDYLKVARFIKEINAERVICVTATATNRVAKDVCEAFGVPNDGFYRTSTYRPNLHLLAEPAIQKEDVHAKLYAFLSENPGSTIIYVTLQRQTELLADDLREHGFHARAFHAGMDIAIKTRLQNDFMKDDSLIIVATIAFGMGIDKSCIRNVVHFNIPSSLESYSQEIGRAGRDGLTSKCIFFASGFDMHLREVFARGDLPSYKSVVRLLKEIFTTGGQYKTDDTLEVAHWDQEKLYDIKSHTLNSIYAQLELRFGLLRNIGPRFTKYTFQPGPLYGQTMQKDNSPAGLAIQSQACGTGRNGSKLKWWKIDVDNASVMFKLRHEAIIQKLQDLNERGILELKMSGVIQVYRLMKRLPHESTEIEEIAGQLYHNMQAREEEALHRADQVLALITAEKCFALALAEHFGDKLPDQKKECGHCTWCITHKAIHIAKPIPKELNNSAVYKVFYKVKEHLAKYLPSVKVQDDPHLLARIAFGIASPRVTELKLMNDAITGSLDEYPFKQLLNAFEKLCESCVDDPPVNSTASSHSKSVYNPATTASKVRN